MTQKDSVIIYSGGLDSTTLLYEERERVALAVTFDYGSNHAAREIACARLHCARLGIEHVVIDLAFFKQHFSSSLLSGADAIPDGDYADSNCGLAESRGLKRVLIANHGGDHAIYPDCRPGFIAAMDAAMQAGTYDGVQLVAPYTDISKADIVRRGVQLGIDYGETYSCYKGGEHHCGTCGTCTERREAFLEAGIPDPTTYEK